MALQRSNANDEHAVDEEESSGRRSFLRSIGSHLRERESAMEVIDLCTDNVHLPAAAPTPIGVAATDEDLALALKMQEEEYERARSSLGFEDDRGAADEWQPTDVEVVDLVHDEAPVHERSARQPSMVTPAAMDVGEERAPFSSSPRADDDLALALRMQEEEYQRAQDFMRDEDIAREMMAEVERPSTLFRGDVRRRRAAGGAGFAGVAGVALSDRLLRALDASDERFGGGGDAMGTRGMELDTSGMSYEELLALDEGKVTVGLEKWQLEAHTIVRKCGDGDLHSSGQRARCVICLCDFEVGDSLRQLPCFHKFHQDCVDHHFQTKKVCPICLLEVGSDPVS